MNRVHYHYRVQRVPRALLASPVSIFDISVLCGTSGLVSFSLITDLNNEGEMLRLENSYLSLKNKQRTGRVC